MGVMQTQQPNNIFHNLLVPQPEKQVEDMII